MNQSIETAVSNYFSQWLGHHPYLVWSISHPLPSFGLLILLAFIVGGLIKAVGRVFEQIGLWVLKTPFKLLQPIFRRIWSSIAQTFGHNNLGGWQIATNPIHPPLTERRAQILERLQVLNREQHLLLEELSSLGAVNLEETSQTHARQTICTIGHSVSESLSQHTEI